VIKKGSLLNRSWQIEWQGIEFSEMRSSIKVDNDTIITQVATKESGVCTDHIPPVLNTLIYCRVLVVYWAGGLLEAPR